MKKIFMFSAVYFFACAFNFLFAQGTWIQKADFGGSNRCDVVSFSIDTKGYVGTGRNSITTLEYADFWEYDPASNVWSQKADFGGGARHAAVAFSIGNKGYVGTGVSLNGPVYFNDFYEYDPNSNSWIQVSSFPASARHSAVGFAIGDKGYVGTGYDGTWKIDFWQYSPANDSWIQRADFAGMARYEAASFTIGTKGYIGLGQTSGTGLVDFWEYDTVNNLWTPIADFTGGARWSTFSFSIGNKGYVGTGVNFPAHFNDFWSYSPISNAWTQETSFGLERWDATAFSIAGKGYALTGVNNSGNQKDCWEYSPSCNVDPNPFPQDTITACGASFLLDAGSGYDSYLWNTGSTSQSITIGQSGWYICSVNQGSCSVMDSMYLDLHNVEILNNDTSICSGSSVMLTAIATGLGTGSACQLSELPSSLRQGLLAWYPFCGNATDQSGNGNDGTVYGASLTSDRFGQPGNAYSFNGSNNYIEVLNSANWQFADSKQSISFWIYLPVIPNPIGNDMAILSKTNQNLPIDPSGNSNTGFEVIFGQNIYSPDLDYRFKSGAGSSWLVTRIAQSNFTINQWFHVVFVTDKQKDSCYAYLNGNLINRQLIPTSTVIGQNNLPLLMGKGYWTSNGIPSNYYNGKLDDVGIWNRAISPEEVKQLYSGLTYLWSTGDSGQVITVSPTQTTTYVVTASNGINNCTASVTVTVNEATSSLTDISTCDAYTWNGQIYTQPGVYTYHTTNVAGCDSIATLNLTFNLPSMVASSAGASANNIAPGTPVTLNVNGGTLGTGASWKWYTTSCGGTSIGSGSSLIVTPQITTTYFVRAEGVCNSTACVSVTVTLIPSVICQAPTSVNSSAGVTICSGASTTLTLVGGILPPGGVWRWYKGGCGSGTPIATGSSIQVNVCSTTSYYVRGEGTGCGPTSCASVTIQVLNRPSLPGSISGPTFGLCNLTGVSYTILPVSGATSYQWTTSPGISITSGQGSNGITVSFGGGCTSGGTISVRAVNSCGTSSTRCLSVSTVPSSPALINGPGGVCHNQIYVYSCQPVQGATSYTWSAPQGASILTGQGTVSITVRMGNRSGQVSVKARNTCGYSNPKTKSTSISCREAEVFSVGVDEVQVYPNPTAENITLKFTMTEQGKVHLELFDLAGRSLIKLDAEYVAAGEYTLELPLIDQGLAPGTYLIRVIRNEKQDVLRIVLSY